MNVAFIPVRGGSKSIPLKNIKEICGKPLVYWTIKAASLCKSIDVIYVSTDSQIIKDTVNKFNFKNVKVIDRSNETASDIASTESAMLEFANKYDFDNIVLIQATSPLLQSIDLDKGFSIYNEKGVDSVLSVVKQKRFIWEIDDKNNAKSINYDYKHRPRRQEFDGYYVENGAFYITSKKALIETKNRMSGNIRIVEMCEDSYNEIDEPSDWIIIESLMKRNKIKEDKCGDIKLLLTDCDGCLTDGGMYYSENGDELKKFNTKDGMGFTLLRQAGILVGVLTGEETKLNARRFKKLKVDEYYFGCRNKLQAVKELCHKHSISLDNVCYIGDDLNDLDVMTNVGFACCPMDANEKILSIADYICKRKGGNGCVREVIDMILNNKQV